MKDEWVPCQGCGGKMHVRSVSYTKCVSANAPSQCHFCHHGLMEDLKRKFPGGELGEALQKTRDVVVYLTKEQRESLEELCNQRSGDRVKLLPTQLKETAAGTPLVVCTFRRIDKPLIQCHQLEYQWLNDHWAYMG